MEDSNAKGEESKKMTTYKKLSDLFQEFEGDRLCWKILTSPDRLSDGQNAKLSYVRTQLDWIVIEEQFRNDVSEIPVIGVTTYVEHQEPM